jgi:DAACS family dicarboxylate/amino acid:cation (Na+ or H+) symporter
MKLHTKILLGLVLGAVAGLASYTWAHDSTTVAWLRNNLAEPVGQIFLRLLIMTVVPLVFCSLTVGVAGLGDVRRIGRVGGRAIVYFLVTTALSATLGLILVNLVRPGDGLDVTVREQLMATYGGKAQEIQASMTLKPGVDMVVNIVPRNPVKAAADLDMLGIIFFSVMVGVALTLIPEEKAKPVQKLLEAGGDVIVKIIDIAMRLAPYGVFGLIFVVTSKFGWNLLGALGKYMAVVLLGLLLHAAITLSAIVRLLGGLNPVTFFSRIRASMITAFSTSSSNATLPTNLAVAEEQLGISPRIAGFVLPIGSTMCMNGTALYEGVTVLFLAQVFGVPLSIGTQAFVIVLSVITAVGAAGVPGGSLPLLMVVLATVGVPPEAIAVILGVDRLLDMSRTTLNVIGDMSATVYVARTEDGWDARRVKQAA